MLNKRKLGSEYERRAVEYLAEQKNMQILCQNFRYRQGEIDIIARDNECLVFVEVKYRVDIQKGDPAEAVNYFKQKRISNTARFYMYVNKIPEYSKCRFDVVIILGNRIKHIKNAFDAV